MGRFKILPHPKAPMFSNPNDAELVLEQVIEAIINKRLSQKELIEVCRQAGFVNLWFFLKFIAGDAGPFDFLNTGVHLDLCNFRQSEHCMDPGSRTFHFLPRGFAKTTIVTTGGTSWEGLRNPNIRIRIINAVIDRAHAFKRTAQRIFDGNKMFAACYPEYVPRSGAARWNETEFVLPNATRLFNEPTVKAGGAKGASEGDHHDLLVIDDVIGLDDVDANFNPNENMKAVASWLDTNLTALLISPERSRVLGVATRYGRGDVYQQFWDDCKAIYGYPAGVNLLPKEDGTWKIYYRHVIENGAASNPFVMTVSSYEKLLRDKPIVAALQYANNVDISINNELAKFQIKTCSFKPIDRDNSDYEITIPGFTDKRSEDPERQPVRLSECHVCLSVDWAGTDRKKSSATCRTSIGLWAIDSFERRYRLDQMVGYYSMPDTFDHIFRLAKKYAGFISATLLETNAMQLGIYDLLLTEQSKRRIFIHPEVSNGKGDKIVRIRSTLSLPLSEGKLFFTPETALEFNQERLAFPNSTLDVLDESEKAISYLLPPISKEENNVRIAQQEAYNADYEMQRNNAGY